MFRHPIVAPANESADRGWSGVENVDSIFLDDFPETIGFGPVWGSLVHNGRCTIRQRTVNDIAVAGHPADVGGAPKNVFITNVEDILHGRVNADEITASGMQDPLRLHAGSARIEKVKRMLAIEGCRRKVCIDILQFPGPPDIAASFHGNFVSCSSKNDHAFDGRATA